MGPTRPDARRQWREGRRRAADARTLACAREAGTRDRPAQRAWLPGCAAHDRNSGRFAIRPHCRHARDGRSSGAKRRRAAAAAAATADPAGRGAGDAGRRSGSPVQEAPEQAAAEQEEQPQPAGPQGLPQPGIQPMPPNPQGQGQNDPNVARPPGGPVPVPAAGAVVSPTPGQLPVPPKPQQEQ